MNKKSKQKPQKNLSLRERLEKHWHNRKWTAFLSLFLRDKSASLATAMGDKFYQAVFNCFTEALFLNRDFEEAENAIALTDHNQGEEEKQKCPDEIKNCAAIAMSFINMRKGNKAELPTFPFKAVHHPAYSALYKGMRDMRDEIPSKTKKELTKLKNPLVEKFAQQFEKLGGKSLLAYTNWLKTAKTLEESTEGESFSMTFRSLRAAVELIRMLHLTGQDALKDLNDLLRDKCFREIHAGDKSHPVLTGLIELFCRTGENKFGDDWGRGARMLFRSEKYARLIDKGTEAPSLYSTLDILAKDKSLTEQDIYLIKALHIDKANNPEGIHGVPNAFKVLSRIGRKWRTKAWTKTVEQLFGRLVMFLPIENFISASDIPYESLSTGTIVMLALTIDENVSRIDSVRKRLPLKLAKDEIEDVNAAIAVHIKMLKTFSLKLVLELEKLLDKKSMTICMIDTIQYLAEASELSAAKCDSPDTQAWCYLGRDVLKKLGEILPPDNPEGCFCRICADPKLGAENPGLFEALFKALPQDSAFGISIFAIFALRKVEPSIVARVFKHSYKAYKEQGIEFPDIWKNLIGIILNIKDNKRRIEIATKVLSAIPSNDRRKRQSEFRKTVSLLEKISKENYTLKGS